MEILLYGRWISKLFPNIIWIKYIDIGISNNLNMLFDKIYSHKILSASRHYHIGVLLGGDAKLLKCWLDQSCVLVEDMLQVTPSLFYVTKYSPEF